MGCGLIGRRRAVVAAANARSICAVVVDSNADVARALASDVGCESASDWRSVVKRDDIDAVVIATPNGFLAEISIEALRHGKHVLVEKPMGRSLDEAERMRSEALTAGRTLKVGFNHRYHPAIFDAHRRFQAGAIGKLINIRCRYGHGGRPGYEKEWRGNRELSGGGELTDQGVHVVDLLHWFAGVPTIAFAMLQTAVWPLSDLEDNAFGMFRFSNGVVATFHTSWTQWKNLFSLEVFGDRGVLIVEGLGRSYGVETLTLHRRRPEGGAPRTEQLTFEGDDESWSDEWNDFVTGLLEFRSILGSADDGVVAMSMLDALYRSVERAEPVQVDAGVEAPS